MWIEACELRGTLKLFTIYDLRCLRHGGRIAVMTNHSHAWTTSLEILESLWDKNRTHLQNDNSPFSVNLDEAHQKWIFSFFCNLYFCFPSSYQLASNFLRSLFKTSFSTFSSSHTRRAVYFSHYFAPSRLAPRNSTFSSAWVGWQGKCAWYLSLPAPPSKRGNDKRRFWTVTQTSTELNLPLWWRQSDWQRNCRFPLFLYRKRFSTLFCSFLSGWKARRGGKATKQQQQHGKPTRKMKPCLIIHLMVERRKRRRWQNESGTKSSWHDERRRGKVAEHNINRHLGVLRNCEIMKLESLRI